MLFIVCNTSFAQELFIISPAAANIAKRRAEIRNNILSYNSFKYFHNSFEVNYGILGNLSTYNKVYYTTSEGYKFWGDIESSFRYRFLQTDKKNFHYRFALQSGIRVPINSNSIVEEKINYELHPGHTITVYNFGDDITVPIIDFHSADNYTILNDIIATALWKKTALSIHAGYNINLQKSDFKFGSYYSWGFAIGHLLFPKDYSGYDDININLYSEWKSYYFEKNKFIGEEVVNSGGFRLDGSIGIQSILFSSLMIEGLYRFPVHSNEYVNERASSVLLSFRYLFFL